MKKSWKVLWMTCLLCLIMLVPTYAAEWKQDSVGWWWQNDDGSYPVSEWKQINGKWYYFENTGYMVANRWEGNYYLGSDGAMLINAVTPDGYTVGADGAWIADANRQTSSVSNETYGWVQDGKGWRFKNDDGSMKINCWYTDPATGYKYYFDTFGYMSTGKTFINNKWYYFANDGALAHNGEVEDGLYCSNKGELVTADTPGVTFYAHVGGYPDRQAVFVTIDNLRNVPLTLGSTCELDDANFKTNLYLLDVSNRRFANSVTIPAKTQKTVAYCSPDLKPVNFEFDITTAKLDVYSEYEDYWFSMAVNNAEHIVADDLTLFHIDP